MVELMEGLTRARVSELHTRALAEGFRSVLAHVARSSGGGLRGLLGRLARIWDPGRGLVSWWPLPEIPRSDFAAETFRRSGPAAIDREHPGVPNLVSVVLPVFNQSRHLGESIESVLAQTHRDWELIVVDDGSTENLEPILRRYHDSGDDRIRIFRQPNQKLPRALSHGFAKARGEFRTWTSADNRMGPRMLERLTARLRERSSTALVYADFRAIDENGAPLRDAGYRPGDKVSPEDDHIRPGRDADHLNLEIDNVVGPCFMYRAWAGRLLGDYDPLMGVEDYDYWMRMNAAFRIEHLGDDEPLYEYRVHGDSLTGRREELRIEPRTFALRELDRERRRAWERRWRSVSAPEAELELESESEGGARAEWDREWFVFSEDPADWRPGLAGGWAWSTAIWLSRSALERDGGLADRLAAGIAASGHGSEGTGGVLAIGPDRAGIAAFEDRGVAALTAASREHARDLGEFWAKNRAFLRRRRLEIGVPARIARPRPWRPTLD